MYLGHSLSYGDTVVQDNFYKIKIVIKKLDCFGSNEPHNDAQQVVSRHVIAVHVKQLVSRLGFQPNNNLKTKTHGLIENHGFFY